MLDFEPKKGPESGGSTIKVIGRRLNTGRHIEAYVADLRCKLVDRMRYVPYPCLTAVICSFFLSFLLPLILFFIFNRMKY